MFRNILISYDGSASARAALEQAFDLARAQNAKLTVLTVAPPVPPLATYGGVSRDRIEDEAKEWADRLAREAVAAAPDEVIVHHVERSGQVGPQIVKELDAGGYDLIVLGSRGRGRTSSNVFGSVNGYVHYHLTVPLLSIALPPDS